MEQKLCCPLTVSLQSLSFRGTGMMACSLLSLIKGSGGGDGGDHNVDDDKKSKHNLYFIIFEPHLPPHSTMAFLCFLRHTRYLPTSELLCELVSVPGTSSFPYLFQVPIWKANMNSAGERLTLRPQRELASGPLTCV